MKLNQQHLLFLRSMVNQARATDSDVGMDVNVLVALLDDLAAIQQLADEREALINQIDAVVEGGDLWEHSYDGDDSGEWVICEGRETLAAMLRDYREGPKEVGK